MIRLGLMVGAFVAGALLYMVAARAETEAEYQQGAVRARPSAAPGSPAAVPGQRAGSLRATEGTLARGAGLPAPARRAEAPQGAWGAEAAKTATRLTLEQREERGLLREFDMQGRFEWQAARLALVRSQHPGIRSFAEELARQHETHEGDLLRLLHARGMARPMMDVTLQRSLTRMGRLSGARFDREFTQLVVMRQGDGLAPLERLRQRSGDPAVHAWTERQLPVLRYHLALAAKLSPALSPARNQVARGQAQPRSPVRPVSGSSSP